MWYVAYHLQKKNKKQKNKKKVTKKIHKKKGKKKKRSFGWYLRLSVDQNIKEWGWASRGDREQGVSKIANWVRGAWSTGVYRSSIIVVTGSRVFVFDC